MTTTETIIFKDYFAKAVSYADYIAAFENAIQENTPLAEADQVPLFKYYALNHQRSTRIYNHYTVTDAMQQAINALPDKVQWLVITEPWCGDSAQNLPVLAKVADASNGKIDLRIVYRDANLDLMDQFLTNGGRSIPKLLQLNEQGELTATWGPRPAAAQQLVAELRAANIPHDEYIASVHKWYADNKAADLTKDILVLFSKA